MIVKEEIYIPIEDPYIPILSFDGVLFRCKKDHFKLLWDSIFKEDPPTLCECDGCLDMISMIPEENRIVHHKDDKVYERRLEAIDYIRKILIEIKSKID